MRIRTLTIAGAVALISLSAIGKEEDPATAAEPKQGLVTLPGTAAVDTAAVAVVVTADTVPAADTIAVDTDVVAPAAAPVAKPLPPTPQQVLIANIDSLKATIATLEAQLKEQDMSDLRAANATLKEQYSPEAVEHALELFDRVSDKKLKTEFAALRTTLSAYGQATQNARDVLTQLQEHAKRETMMGADAFKADATKAINASDAMVAAVKKGGYKIYYLHDILSEALERVKKHSIPDAKADFTDLIGKL